MSTVGNINREIQFKIFNRYVEICNRTPRQKYSKTTDLLAEEFNIKVIDISYVIMKTNMIKPKNENHIYLEIYQPYPYVEAVL